MSYLLRYASCSWSSMVKGNGKHLLKYWKVRWADIGLNGRTRRKADLGDLEEIWTIHLYFWYPWCEKHKPKEKSFVWTTKCIGKISWRGKARHCWTENQIPWLQVVGLKQHTHVTVQTTVDLWHMYFTAWVDRTWKVPWFSLKQREK